MSIAVIAATIAKARAPAALKSPIPRFADPDLLQPDLDENAGAAERSWPYLQSIVIPAWGTVVYSHRKARTAAALAHLAQHSIAGPASSLLAARIACAQTVPSSPAGEQ